MAYNFNQPFQYNLNPNYNTNSPFTFTTNQPRNNMFRQNSSTFYPNLNEHPQKNNALFNNFMSLYNNQIPQSAIFPNFMYGNSYCYNSPSIHLQTGLNYPAPQPMQRQIKPKEPIIISDDQQESQKKVEPARKKNIIPKKPFQQKLIQKKIIQDKTAEKSTLILKPCTKIIKKQVKKISKEKLKQQKVKNQKIKHPIKIDKPVQQIKKGERQSFRQKKIKLKFGDDEERQINRRQQTGGKIRIGKEYQCVLPNTNFSPQEYLIWINTKRQNLLNRRIG